MSLRDEIEVVIEEEAKKNERLSRQKEVVSKRRTRALARQHPTYLAVLIGKLIYRFRKPQPPKRPVTPKNGIPGYEEHDFIEKPKITAFTIVKRDIQNLFHGRPKKQKNPATKNSNESWDDWKDSFEEKR